MVYGARLESVFTETYPGFESLSLRKVVLINYEIHSTRILTMKNLFSLLAIAGIMFAANPAAVFAQLEEVATEEVMSIEADSVSADSVSADTVVADSASKTVLEEPTLEVAETAADVEEIREVLSFHQTVKRYFIEGGAAFMASVLICLILGLALSIERIIYLNMATTNTKKLVNEIDDCLQKGGVDAAKEVCRNTPGPVATIFHQGLDRSEGSYEEVAKAIEDYGSVEMSKLERGLSWISLFIALAPMWDSWVL